MHRIHTTLLAAVVLSALILSAASAADQRPDTWRWQGHDFVFCFVTDDGTTCNLGWAELGREMDFRFTIAVNQKTLGNWNRLTTAECNVLAADGFEIAQHAYSHGFDGVPESCSTPPRGSLGAYFDCAGDPDSLAFYFEREIDRASLADAIGWTVDEVRTVAYPRHIHGKDIIDGLVAEGYLGARAYKAGNSPGYSDFTTLPVNTWDGGISLFRVPVAASTAELFGDHCADPPVHFTPAQTEAAFMPLITQARADGGILSLYTHHYGDDNYEHGTYYYNAGGMTDDELRIIIDLVRANGGTVMTFSEALTHYRSVSSMTETADGDLVWVSDSVGVPDEMPAPGAGLTAAPNPFNPRTTVSFELPTSQDITLTVHDLRGRRLDELARGHYVSGVHSLSWDGRDARGRELPSGTYLLRLVGGDVRESRRVALVR